MGLHQAVVLLVVEFFPGRDFPGYRRVGRSRPATLPGAEDQGTSRLVFVSGGEMSMLVVVYLGKVRTWSRVGT